MHGKMRGNPHILPWVYIHAADRRQVRPEMAFQLKELIVKKSVLCLALSLALVLAFAPVRAAENMPAVESSKANPVDQFTGTVWQKTPEAEKLAFLFGVETAITLEFFVNGKVAEKATKEGKRPVYTLSPFEKGWMKAFKGVNRADVAKMVDAWYAANPQGLERPVMNVIWREIIEPRLDAKK